MNPDRLAAISGLCYTLPVLLWTLPLLVEAGSWQQATTVLHQATGAVLLLQGIMVALFVPGLLSRQPPVAGLSAILLLVAVPWPLLALAVLTGSASAFPLMLSQSGLIAGGMLLWGAVRVPLPRALSNLCPATLQVVSLAVVLRLSGKVIHGVLS